MTMTIAQRRALTTDSDRETMTGRQQEQLATLVRRRLYLIARIATKGGKGERSTGHDGAELKAINWAIQIVRAAAQDGRLPEYEQAAVPR